ncbi:MAG: dihydrolipoamide acetyltransferase family protein [Candidatus Brocadiia bacterium]|jgi:pyruvate/2-oxoglutarate dehydrogenase complex dihydrolipoamide acyltransferase (E2) component
MKINVVMPQLGESVSEGEVIRWLKRAGDAVRRDEALVEVKTDKATVEIPAPSSGTLSEIVVPEGQTVKVGAGIAVIESTSEAAALSVEGASSAPRKIEPAVTRAPKAAATSPAAKPVTPAAKKPAPVPPGKPAAPAAEKPATPPAGKAVTQPPGKAATSPAGKQAEPASKPTPRPPQAPRPQMTPLARRIASEFGLDPSQIQGTGEGGRITREDVLNARKGTPSAEPAGAEAPEAAAARESTEPAGAEEAAETESPATAESAAAPAEEPGTIPAAKPAEPPVAAASEEDEIVALSPIRRRIAARLVQSSQTIPRVTTAIEADMTPLAELRKEHRESYEKAGLKLSYMPFIMNATVAALKASPAVNASWGGEKLILHKRVHLGVAVSVEGGLVVPVIRNADDLSVRQLTERLRDVAEHARTGKLAADEVRGGTFTITNPGVFGTVFSTPIINPPEAAILAVCRIAETPVAREGKIVIRYMMNLCLSYDHRIIDGETAIQFLQHIRATLEAAKFEMG